MKIFSRVILITAAVFIGLGILLGVVSLSLGAKPGGLRNWEIYDFTQTYTDVTELSFDVSAGEVNIVSGTEFSIEAQNVPKEGFSSSVEDGVWIIKEQWPGSVRWFTWNGWPFQDEAPLITITLPEDFIAEKAEFSLAAGKADIEQLQAKSASLTVSAGQLTAEGLALQDAQIHCGAGQITLSGSITGGSKAECGAGQITLDLTGKEKDYNYTVNVGVGEVKINESSYHGFGDQVVVNNDAKNDLDIQCGVGQIKLKIGE